MESTKPEEVDNFYMGDGTEMELENMMEASGEQAAQELRLTKGLLLDDAENDQDDSTNAISEVSTKQ